MPVKRFSLEPGQPRRLEVSWGWNWKNLKVSLNGESLAEIADKRVLRKGREISLPDGSALLVRLTQSWMYPELQLIRNGVALPGSASDPVTRVAAAYGIIFFIAGFTALVGILATAFNVGFLLNLGFDLWSLIDSGIFVLLGFFVRRRSLVALVVAIALFSADGVYSAIVLTEQMGRFPTGGIVVRVFLLIPMFKAIPAIRELRNAKITQHVDA